MTESKATDKEREALNLALAAMREISLMYGHTWDRADDGALVMLAISIPRFEAAHAGIEMAILDVQAALSSRDEATADAVDAKRYRWWREYAMQTDDVSADDAFLDCESPEEVDAVIDAAIASQERAK